MATNKTPRGSLERPQLKSSSNSPKPAPRERFGLPDEDVREFARIQEELNDMLEGKVNKRSKQSALDTVKILKEELDKTIQELSDSRELDHYHTTQVRKLEEDNDRLMSIVEEFDGLSYLEKQELLVKRSRETELEIEALQKSFLKIRTIYEKRLSNLRRKVAKEEYNETKPRGGDISAKKFTTRQSS